MPTPNPQPGASTGHSIQFNVEFTLSESPAALALICFRRRLPSDSLNPDEVVKLASCSKGCALVFDPNTGRWASPTQGLLPHSDAPPSCPAALAEAQAASTAAAGSAAVPVAALFPLMAASRLPSCAEELAAGQSPATEFLEPAFLGTPRSNIKGATRELADVAMILCTFAFSYLCRVTAALRAAPEAARSTSVRVAGVVPDVMSRPVMSSATPARPPQPPPPVAPAVASFAAHPVPDPDDVSSVGAAGGGGGGGGGGGVRAGWGSGVGSGSGVRGGGGGGQPRSTTWGGGSRHPAASATADTWASAASAGAGDGWHGDGGGDGGGWGGSSTGNLGNWPSTTRPRGGSGAVGGAGVPVNRGPRAAAWQAPATAAADATRAAAVAASEEALIQPSHVPLDVAVAHAATALATAIGMIRIGDHAVIASRRFQGSKQKEPEGGVADGAAPIKWVMGSDGNPMPVGVFWAAYRSTAMADRVLRIRRMLAKVPRTVGEALQPLVSDDAPVLHGADASFLALAPRMGLLTAARNEPAAHGFAAASWRQLYDAVIAASGAARKEARAVGLPASGAAPTKRGRSPGGDGSDSD